MKFDNNGIGKLADAQSCTVTEKRNGSYELKLICPADGIHAEMLEEGNVILAKPSDTMQPQPFRIYKITTPIDGKLEVQARHISYQLNFITVSPFSVTGCVGAMQGLKSHAASDCPFSVWTDVASSAMFTVSVPASFRNCLGGMDGSVSDTEGRINESLSSTESKVNTSLSETENRVTARVENAKSDLTAKVAAAERQMNQNAQNVAQTNKALNARMDQIAKGRTSDTEVLDARVDSEGNTFDNLGAAIRSIYPKAKEGLDALQESKVDANYDATGELTEGITVKYSLHALIDMSIRYHNIDGKKIKSNEIGYMQERIMRLSKNEIDTYILKGIKDFIRYCQGHGYEKYCDPIILKHYEMIPSIQDASEEDYLVENLDWED